MATAIPSLDTIFCAAIEIASEAKRVAYLAGACGDDDELRVRVAKLVAAHFRAGSFLEAPASDPGATAAAARESASMLAEGPGTVIGPYTLREQIGEGGMGLVFVAEQQQPVRRKVALKVIKPGLDTRQVVARFEAERQALAMMDHPNIAKVLDGGETASGRPYFVMELVKGVSLTDYCDQNRLTTRQRLELFLPVCQAVQHAHQKGIIHRDLKPANILVTVHDVTPVVKVIDFGIAKATGQQLTDKTLYTCLAQMIGTPQYMSPEQAGLSGLDVDTRSDIYALGVLLYELLTGTTPFESESLRQAGYDEMRRIIREDEPPKPSTRLGTLAKAALSTVCERRSVDLGKLSHQVRGELDWIVMKCLEKDRNRRYETANGFAADVQRYLNDEPVQACPQSAGYRFRKFGRKNKAALTTACLVSGALLIGTAVSIWQAIRAVDAGKTAQEEAQKAKQAQADTQAFADFLVDDMLAVARPEGVQGGLGVGVTVARALEAAEAGLEKRFAGRPLAEATAREAIGGTWKNLAKYKEAERHLRRAAELREQELGPDDLMTLASHNALGGLLQLMGRDAEAIALYEETLKKRQVKLGLDHPDTLQSMHNLAVAYQDAGKSDLALPMLEQTLEKARAILGPDHPHTLICMQNVAEEYLSGGKLDLALSLFQENLEKRKAKLGPDHPHTLFTMNGLARTYRAMGKLDLALPLLEQALAKMQAKLGPDHRDTLACMDGLAGAYWSAKKLDRSVPLFEEVLKRSQAKLGPEHPDTLRTMANLGVNYWDAGRLPEATSLLKQSWEGVQKRHGPLADSFAWIPTALAETYDLASQFANSEPLRREALEKARKRDGEASLPAAGALAVLGRNLLKQQKYADADSLLRECLRIREQKAPDEWSTFNTKSTLGGSLLGQKKYAEAEPLLLSGYEGLKQREEKIPPQGKILLTEAIERLVQLYDAWGKPEKAAEWRKKLPVTNSAKPAETKKD